MTVASPTRTWLLPAPFPGLRLEAKPESGVGPQRDIFLGTPHPTVIFPDQLLSAGGWGGACLLLATVSVLLRRVGVAVPDLVPVTGTDLPEMHRAAVPEPQFSGCRCGQRVLLASRGGGYGAFLRGGLPAQNSFSLFLRGDRRSVV